MLIFLRGFATPPGAYDALLAPLRAVGIDVITPQWYGLNGLFGRYTATDEARDTWELVQQLDQPTVVAGHSRGGQVAWRVAQLATAHDSRLVRAVALLDPVDGSGPKAGSGLATSTPAQFRYPTLILGAALGGRCAPANANHEVFAAATPHAEHLVVPDLGHADLLTGSARTWGRRLCGGGSDPDLARGRVSELLSAFYSSAFP